MGRVVSLDVGTKTIGIAATDPLRILASPVETLSRRGVRQDMERLRPHLERLAPDLIVVGLPYELDGSEARSARLARQIGEAIVETFGLTVVYQDERFSSVQAERMLIERGVSRTRRKQVIDQAAAVVILESWLREQAAPHPI